MIRLSPYLIRTQKKATTSLTQFRSEDYSTIDLKENLRRNAFLLPYGAIFSLGAFIESPLILMFSGIGGLYHWYRRKGLNHKKIELINNWEFKNKEKEKLVQDLLRKILFNEQRMKIYLSSENNLVIYNLQMELFYYKERCIITADMEDFLQRYDIYAQFKDPKMGTSGIVEGNAIFFPNTEGYIEQLSIRMEKPRALNFKIVSLSQEDMPNIEKEARMDSPKELYFSTQYLTILDKVKGGVDVKRDDESNAEPEYVVE